MRISLCLLVWNECESCKIQVPQLPQEIFDEIYAIDGGSTDGTIEYLRSQDIAVYQQPKIGLNAAYVFADSLSTCDAVVVFFPKNTIPTGDLKKFRFFLENGYGLVIASRQIPGSVNEEDVCFWRPRKWLVKALAIFAGIIWRREGYWVKDVLHGFKGWRRDAFQRMNVLDYGLSIDIEMVIRAYKFKISRTEFPTTETARQHGSTKFKIWPTGKLLLTYLWFELNRKD
jgi:glycosyltransferase involved in cell wall biosynthesis